MRIAAGLMAVLAVAAVAVGCGGGSPSAPTAGAPAGKPIVTRSPDSLAPANAPAHWLPPEAWVYNHWLPYDETRLYRLLGITRMDLWRQLRDDRRTLAALAARHGWPQPKRLAAALVAPERGRVSARRAKVLEERALRTITQGHLAQHLFFHSLHQFAIASQAPEIFGVTDVAFRSLRRAELSPLAIARLHGRSPGRVEALAIAVLDERMRTGVRGGAMPAAQGRRLLRRQLSQLPRWLDQARYNGPPTTTNGALLAVPRDYASNPSISADGRHVAYEAYRQKLPLAVSFGEIAVLRADLDTQTSTLVSALRAGNPISAYNAAISGDGTRVTYESSPGNDNFAKRYGRIGVLLTDLERETTRGLDRPLREAPESQSAYNPVIAADGTREAFQAVRGGRTVIVVRDLPAGRERIAAQGAPVGGAAFADLYEPGLSADGSKVVYTLATGRVDAPDQATSQVLVHDLRAGTTAVASRADGPDGAEGDGFSADAAISPDGRWVAFTTEAASLGAVPGRPRLLVRDLAGGRTLTVPTGAARVLDPVVARAGRVVAFTARHGTRAQVMAWTRATGALELVSRGSGMGGGAADRDAEDPSISADGTHVAFASAATNLARRPDDSRAIFVRDLRRLRTQLVSDPTAAYPAGALAKVVAKLKAAGPPVAAAPVAVRRPSGDGDGVAITDNAFVAGADRPTVRLRAGDELTWSWLSRQSHSIAVRSGPERFAIPARNGDEFTHRFAKPGTYDLVCELHAPGMRMTVVVS